MLRTSLSYPSPADSIRSSLIFGLTLCAMARAENRMGSVSRVEQLLVKAKHVVENILRDLHQRSNLPISDKSHLCNMAEHLQASIGGLDPLWIPNAGRIPPSKDSDDAAAA